MPQESRMHSIFHASHVAFGSFSTGSNRQQVPPSPLCSDCCRNGEPLKPTLMGSTSAL
jgi:hypothetical protein